MPQLLSAGHELVCGSIGMGKSYYVLYKIVQSLMQDRPCCYIDPKGDLYLTLLNFLATTTQGRALWEARKGRILLLNPLTPSPRLTAFNAIAPLQGFAHAQPDLLALLSNALVSHIRRQSGFEIDEANRMANIMSAALGLLVDGGKGSYSLAELPLLFLPTRRPKGSKVEVDPRNPFVRSLLAETRHPGTRTFWDQQWPTWTANARRDWVQSTEGRIYQFLFDERVLLTLCAVENDCLDFRRVVDEGCWLFVNLPYAFLSDTVTTLLGNLLISYILYACMQRPPGGPPYRLILDEARFFNTGPLEIILETSRAYNLWLTLVVQSIEQLCRSRQGRPDERLKEAVLGLCRYYAVFHNAQDAELLAQLMFPLTGQVVSGIRTSGDYEHLPIQAELDEQRRRFLQLGHREMVFFDSLGSDPARVWRTPEVLMAPADPTIAQEFEASHLLHTGRPMAAIEDEIARRQEQIRSTFFGETNPGARSHRRASFGRSLSS